MTLCVKCSTNIDSIPHADGICFPCVRKVLELLGTSVNLLRNDTDLTERLDAFEKSIPALLKQECQKIIETVRKGGEEMAETAGEVGDRLHRLEQGSVMRDELNKYANAADVHNQMKALEKAVVRELEGSVYRMPYDNIAVQFLAAYLSTEHGARRMMDGPITGADLIRQMAKEILDDNGGTDSGSTQEAG